MAFMPCDWGTHRNPQRNINVYLGRVEPDETRRLSGRLCDLHWRKVEPNWAEYEVMADDSAGPFDFRAFLCPSCQEPVDERGIRAFLTAYPAKNDRKDYWLQFHQNCDPPNWYREFESHLR